MARSDTVSLTYTADLSDLKKQLASIPGITAAEARKAVNELNRTNKALLRNQDKVAKGTRQTDRALKDLGDTAGDSESSLRAMGGVLGLLSPEAERAVAAIAELGGGLEGVTKGARVAGVSLHAAIATAGLVGVAVVAAAAAYTSMSQEMERAAAHAEFMREVNDSLEPSIRRVEDAELALAVALGQVSEAQAESTARALDAQRAVEDFAKAQREQRAELSETIETNQRYLDVLDSLGLYSRPLTALGNAVFGFSDSIEQASGELATLDRALQTNAKNQKTARKLTDNAADAKSRNEASTRQQTEAIRDQTAARSALLRSMAAEQDAQAKLATIQEDLATSGDSHARQEMAVNRELERRVALLDDVAGEIGYTQAVHEAFIASQIQAEEQITTLQRERHEAAMLGYEQRRDAARAEMEAAAAEQARIASITRSSLTGIAQAGADAAGLIAEESASSSKEGMIAAWKAQKALTGVVVALRAIEGYMTAASLPPPANIVKAAEVTAAAGVAAAGIAASSPPQFNDTPGVVQLRGGGAIAGAPGDYAAMGKNLDDLAAQVDRARDTDRRVPVEVVAVPSYHGRTYGRARRDAFRRPGPDFDALKRAANSGPGGW